ncbi:MAG: arsenate reductase ArsC [Hyphomonadaceae bacterium]
MKNVLFLCTGNSARSILAEAALSRTGAGAFNAYSAGSQPKGAVHPLALDLLRTEGFDVSRFRSKSWDEFAQEGAPQFDFIITVCDNAAGEVCPVWPGQPITAHWGQRDPAAVEGSDAVKRQAFAEAYRLASARIEASVALPLASLSDAEVRRALNAIGESAS